MAKRRLGNFRCGQCGRTFGMAGHLGRHMAAMHGTKSKGAKHHAVRATRLPVTALVQVDLLAELVERARLSRDELAAQRATVDRQLAALDQLLATLGGAVRRPATVPAPKPAGRPRRRMGRPVQSGTLRAYVTQVLKDEGKPMAVRDIVVAVRKAGYPSKSKELPRTVSKALRRMPGVTQVERGVFRAK